MTLFPFANSFPLMRPAFMHALKSDSILFTSSFDMETVQHTVKDWRQQKAGRDDDDKTGEDCIGSRKNLSCCGLQFSYWAHTRQNHCGVHIGIDQRHSFKIGIAGYANC